MKHKLKLSFLFLVLLVFVNCDGPADLDTEVLGYNAVYFHNVSRYECEKVRDSLNANVIQVRLYRMATLIDTVANEILRKSGGINENFGMYDPDATIDVQEILKKHSFVKIIHENMSDINKYNERVNDHGIKFLDREVESVLFSDKSLLCEKFSNRILASQVVLSLTALESFILAILKSDSVRKAKV